MFALAALLGFRFAPRISDALSKKLYLLDEVGEAGPLGTLAFGQVNRKLIVEQWDEMRRVASSIRHDTVSASLLMRKLAAIAAWNTIYLTEAFATLRRRGEEIAETTVAHIAPLGWEHINLVGNYHFAPQPGRSLDNLRPLRLGVSHEGEEAAQQEAV